MRIFVRIDDVLGEEVLAMDIEFSVAIPLVSGVAALRFSPAL
jgi:hypothetical protein